MPEPIYDPHVGWVCPSCKATYAPWVASCPRCPMSEADKHPFVVTSSATTYSGVCAICAHPFSEPNADCLLPEAHADRADG
jgi:hypothetical protein